MLSINICGGPAYDSAVTETENFATSHKKWHDTGALWKVLQQSKVVYSSFVATLFTINKMFSLFCSVFIIKYVYYVLNK